MPTDGADFGRMKACYGKAYSAARSGADVSEVAEIVAFGIERDIRRDGGAPVFRAVMDLLVMISQSANGHREAKLLAGIEALNCEFADWSLTRHFAAAAEKIGLSYINEGHALSRPEAAAMLLALFGRGRCLDPLIPYLTKNRTQSLAASRAITDGIADRLIHANALRSLADRMVNASPKGLPPKVPKQPPLEHSASALNEINLLAES